MRHLNRFYYMLRINTRKTRLVIISVLALCFIAASLMFYSLSISKPYMGLSLSLSNQGWEVQSLDPNGLAANAGISEGDKPVEINNQEPRYKKQKGEKNEKNAFCINRLRALPGHGRRGLCLLYGRGVQHGQRHDGGNAEYTNLRYRYRTFR